MAAGPRRFRVQPDLGRDAVRGEHDDRAGRHLVDLRHEDRAALFQRATTCVLCTICLRT
jgi:hypothetical protein